MIRRGELKEQDGIGYDEKRTCAQPGCGSTFRPTRTVSGQSSEYHCSPECAAAGLLARERAKMARLYQDEGGEA